MSAPFDAGGEGGEDDDEDGDSDAAVPAAAINNGKTLPPRFVLRGTMESPIRGATSGNVEYLAWFRR